jgi:RNA-directed DNA polymerase
MRAVQFKILKQILEKVEVPDYVYAFEIGKSIPEMAAQHVGKSVVISLDLKDFFPSIKQYHLNQIFRHLGFGEKPAQTLSELCTYKSFVPQGALTSPKVSNIVTAFTFGPIVKQYCDTKGYTLSIYADDLVISSNTPLEPVAIKELIRTVSIAAGGYGFKLNKDKIKVMYPNQRQYVCGAVVNRKVNLKRSDRNTLRAIVYNSGKNGVDAEAAKNNLTPSQFISKIAGKLNWFSQLNPVSGNLLKDKFKEVASDHIKCPSAGTGDVKETRPLDSPLPGSIPVPAIAVTVPW